MNYHNITYPDMNNGEGLRVVLWLSGCSHKCKGCQNPQTWDANSGIPFDESAKEELFRELDKDYISGLTLTGGDPLFENNLDGVLDLVTEVNKRYNTTPNEFRLSSPKKSIWLYSGYTWDSIFDYKLQTDILDDNKTFYTHAKIDLNWLKRKNIIKQCDIFVDGTYIDSQQDISLKWKGSKNQNVINVQKSLTKKEIILHQY